MKKQKKKYQKPEIKKEEVAVNFFWDQSRYFDSLSGMNGSLLAACPNSCGCFLSGSKVTLADGESAPIESIATGDVVLSYDPQKNQFMENTVIKNERHSNENQYFIINHLMSVTGNHRVWVHNRTWKRVDELRIGDYLLDRTLQPVEVSSLELKKEEREVYNLHLADAAHTYFVENLLVHNGTFFQTAEKPP